MLPVWKFLTLMTPMLSEHAREYAYSVGGAENSTGIQQYADITIHYNFISIMKN